MEAGWNCAIFDCLYRCHVLCLADPHYVKKCEEVVAAGYEGFRLLAENRARI